MLFLSWSACGIPTMVARSILNRAGGKPLTEDPDREAQDQACKEIKPSGHNDKDDDREAGQQADGFQLLSAPRRVKIGRRRFVAFGGTHGIQMIPIRRNHNSLAAVLVRSVPKQKPPSGI